MKKKKASKAKTVKKKYKELTPGQIKKIFAGAEPRKFVNFDHRINK